MPRRRLGRLSPHRWVEDRYEVQRLLNEQGGMSQVFLAWDKLLSRDVVLKHCPLSIGGYNLNTDALLEAQVAARASHTNLARIYDLLCFEDAYLLVLEYVPGPSLRAALLQRGAFTPRDAIAITHDCCLGLARLHAAGIIHRDLKPENILVVTEDRVRIPKIIDFGISKVLDRGLTVAQSGGRLCLTAPYASPEQARQYLDHPNGDTYPDCKVDARSDVFALGLILHELIGGGLPFPDEPEGTLPQLVYRAHSPAPMLSAALPPVLEAVIARALAPYEHRTESVAILADELANADRQLRPRARRAQQLRPPRPTIARFFPEGLMVVLVLVAIAVLGYVTRSLWKREPDAAVQLVRPAPKPAPEPVELAADVPAAKTKPSAKPQWGSVLLVYRPCDSGRRILFRREPDASAAVLASILAKLAKRLNVRSVKGDGQGMPTWFEVEYKTASYAWISQDLIIETSSADGTFDCDCSARCQKRSDAQLPAAAR
jgi:serine/threonine protein kinase